TRRRRHHHDRHSLGRRRHRRRRQARMRDRRRRQAHGDDRPAGEVKAQSAQIRRSSTSTWTLARTESRQAGKSVRQGQTNAMPPITRRTTARASKREHNGRLTLSNPAVRAAEAAWDRASKHSKRQHSLTFRQLLQYFEKDEVRFTDIAEVA